MRRFPILVLLAVFGFGLWQVVEACGDKLLLVGRGVKFQQMYASVYPGHVLVYARPALGPKAPIRDTKLHNLLRQAGHSVSVIEDASLLEQAIQKGNVDVVLVDLTDAQKADALAMASPSPRPRVVPVRPKVSTPELDQLQQQFVCKLKATDNSTRWLDVIEDAMKARAVARRAQKS